MIMHVEVQAAAEALRETDGSASEPFFRSARLRQAEPDPQRALPAENLFNENPPHSG